ncbi:MAG: hypothetical protein IPG18_15305 [Saprospiraceae bacterium]|nr:hypothetical protein [Saprospiraceae bacterium]
MNRAHFINNTIGLHGKQNAAPLIELSYFTEGQTGVLLDNVTGGLHQTAFISGAMNLLSCPGKVFLAYNTPIQVEDGNEFSYCFDGIALRNLLLLMNRVISENQKSPIIKNIIFLKTIRMPFTQTEPMSTLKIIHFFQINGVGLFRAFYA